MPYKEGQIKKRYYTSSEVAKLLGEYMKTISFWVDNIGIKHKKRYYTPSQVKQIERVKKWRQKGISLETIRKERLHFKDEAVLKII